MRVEKESVYRVSLSVDEMDTLVKILGPHADDQVVGDLLEAVDDAEEGGK